MAAVSSQANKTLVCQNPHSFGQMNVWHGGNPLESPTLLLFTQVSLIAIVTQCIDVCLKPLGQSSLVSHILGGMLFGPSALGNKKVLGQLLFPVKGAVVLETVASFGLMFVYFVWCVKMDLATVLKKERLAISVGVSVFVFTLIVPTGIAFLLIKFVAMEKNLSNALPFIALSQTLTVFMSIAILLTDLKILNTDIGRLTMSSAMFADISGFILAVFLFSVLQNKNGDFLTLICILLSVASLILVVVYLMRPAIIWTVRCCGGGSVNEICVVVILFFVLLTGFLSEIIGQHFVTGPIILGLAVPEGPPIGTALMSKLETLCFSFLYPIYLAVNGLETDIFSINVKSLWIVCVVVTVAFFVKIGAVMLSGYICNLPMKDCIVVGLLLNGRGIGELSMYGMWLESKLLTGQEFSLMVLSIVVINAIIAPVVRCIFDPSGQYQTGRRSTIQHSRRDSELRVMVCINHNEHIPTMLNLLEASYASRESMVAVTALVLLEIHGRARPILTVNEPHSDLRSVSCNASSIDNALKQYAQQNDGCVSVQSFTSVSTFETMFNDICRISLDTGANIVILPFHKRWEIDGTVEISPRSIQGMNIKVLDRAPCSVGILVDRGILSTSPSLFMARASYYVAIFFIGGPDDAETLAYGTRMARHECVYVTVVRFLLFGEENSKDRKRDSDLIDEYRYLNAGNRKFEILNEVVKDGIEMSTCIRRLIDYFDLVMVGKDHPESVMFEGHDQWSECKELGVIGDMLASPDFVTKASILIVQQQRIRGRFFKQNVNNPVPNLSPQLVHDIPIDDTLSQSCTISMDKCDKI